MILEAIQALCPGKRFVVRGDQVFFLDLVDQPPTEEDIAQKIQELKLAQNKHDAISALKAQFKSRHNLENFELSMFALIQSSPLLLEVFEDSAKQEVPDFNEWVFDFGQLQMQILNIKQAQDEETLNQILRNSHALSE